MTARPASPVDGLKRNCSRTLKYNSVKCSCCNRVLVKQEDEPRLFTGPAKRIKLEFDETIVKKERIEEETLPPTPQPKRGGEKIVFSYDDEDLRSQTGSAMSQFTTVSFNSGSNSSFSSYKPRLKRLTNFRFQYGNAPRYNYHGSQRKYNNYNGKYNNYNYNGNWRWRHSSRGYHNRNYNNKPFNSFNHRSYNNNPAPQKLFCSTPRPAISSVGRELAAGYARFVKSQVNSPIPSRKLFSNQPSFNEEIHCKRNLYSPSQPGKSYWKSNGSSFARPDSQLSNLSTNSSILERKRTKNAIPQLHCSTPNFVASAISGPSATISNSQPLIKNSSICSNVDSPRIKPILKLNRSNLSLENVSSQTSSSEKDSFAGIESVSNDEVVLCKALCPSCLFPESNSANKDTSDIEILYNSCDIRICVEEEKACSDDAPAPEVIDISTVVTESSVSCEKEMQSRAVSPTSESPSTLNKSNAVHPSCQDQVNFDDDFCLFSAAAEVGEDYNEDSMDEDELLADDSPIQTPQDIKSLPGEVLSKEASLSPEVPDKDDDDIIFLGTNPVHS